MKWGSESKLWESIKTSGMTRIESGGTAEGIADIEYVLPPWHGWIEMKIARWPPADAEPFYLQSPYTLHQASWLLAHQQPAFWLRSWLLLGIAHPWRQGWDAFIMLSPQRSIKLITGSQPLGHAQLLKLPAVHVIRDQASLIELIKG